jgi:hypothetical protein
MRRIWTRKGTQNRRVYTSVHMLMKLMGGSVRHLYVLCIYCAKCLQFKNEFSPELAIFHMEITYYI